MNRHDRRAITVRGNAFEFYYVPKEERTATFVQESDYSRMEASALCLILSELWDQYNEEGYRVCPDAE